MVDIDRAADDLGRQVPSDADDGETALDLFVGLTIEPSVADGGTGAVPLIDAVLRSGPVEFPGVQSFVRWAEVEAVAGFSPLAISSIVVARDGPNDLAVLTGELPLSSALFERSPGVFSLIDNPAGGREFIDEPNAVASVLNVNFTHRDPSDPTSPLGASTNADVLVAWSTDGDETLLARPRFDEVAQLLDQAGVSSAVVIGDDPGDPMGRFDVRQLSSDLAGVEFISEPFSVLGYGVSISDDERGIATVVYVFGDDDTAQRARGDVEDRWTSDVWYRDEVVPATDLFTVMSSESSGSSVVVTVVPKHDGTTAQVAEILMASSLYFYRTR